MDISTWRCHWILRFQVDRMSANQMTSIIKKRKITHQIFIYNFQSRIISYWEPASLGSVSLQVRVYRVRLHRRVHPPAKQRGRQRKLGKGDLVRPAAVLPRLVKIFLRIHNYGLISVSYHVDGIKLLKFIWKKCVSLLKHGRNHG